jgi:four helix bundle protein
MVINSFEDLHVWQRARELVNLIYRITRNKTFSEDKGLIDQIRRACVSIMSNISEGFERGSNVEFIQFLYIAKASCGEVRCQIIIAFDQGYINEKDLTKIKELTLKVSGMIGNLINYLRKSKIKGAKFKKPPRRSIKEELDEILAKQASKNP